MGKPPIQETGGTLVKKLSELYVADRQVVNRLLGKIFPVDFNNIGLWHESTEAFKTLILSTSNSGAKDAKGLSLKLTKVMFQECWALVKQFHNISGACLKLGYFPKVWTFDTISFLYKNKGDRMDAAMYRPITIAPSLGKHLEKAIATYLGTMDDRNAYNHAYVRR